MGLGYPCYRPPCRHREGRKGESEYKVREHRRTCSNRVIGIIRSMPNNLEVAIEMAEKVAEDTLRIIVKEKEEKGEKHIILRNPEENDRRHGHVVIYTTEDGKKSVEYARPYGEFRPRRR